MNANVRRNVRASKWGARAEDSRRGGDDRYHRSFRAVRCCESEHIPAEMTATRHSTPLCTRVRLEPASAARTLGRAHDDMFGSEVSDGDVATATKVRASGREPGAVATARANNADSFAPVLAGDVLRLLRRPAEPPARRPNASAHAGVCEPPVVRSSAPFASPRAPRVSPARVLMKSTPPRQPQPPVRDLGDRRGQAPARMHRNAHPATPPRRTPRIRAAQRHARRTISSHPTRRAHFAGVQALPPPLVRARARFPRLGHLRPRSDDRIRGRERVRGGLDKKCDVPPRCCGGARMVQGGGAGVSDA